MRLEMTHTKKKIMIDKLVVLQIEKASYENEKSIQK